MPAGGEAPTSIDTDLMDGYAAALEAARSEAAAGATIDHRLAVSSAGGGLKVAAVGLVADLTAAAARQAALNAGARVEAVVSGRLGQDELDELRAARPEIVLFAGGTDGGQAELVLENARRLGESGIGGHAVVACNAEVAEEAATLLRSGGIAVAVAGNVMPELGRLEDRIGPGSDPPRLPRPRDRRQGAQRQPRVRADGEAADPRGRPRSDAAARTTSSSSTSAAPPPMSTPSRRTEVVTPGIEDPLLPPPPALRTVEGDLGLRSGAGGVLAADQRWIEAEAAVDEAVVRQSVSIREQNPEWLPEDDRDEVLETLLAVGCGAHALRRHCGTMLLTRGGGGPPTLVRDGPDLREAALFLGTGGVFAHRSDGEAILRRVLERRAPRSLAPDDPRIGVDEAYVLAAAGLLATEDREAAQRLLRQELHLSSN